jgi:hypothetical protein
VTVTTHALIGRFRPDRRSFDARPIRMHGQPTRILPHLAAMYTRQPAGRSAQVTDILLAHDWAQISVVAVPGRSTPHHDWIPGYGNCYPPSNSPGPLTGHVVEDQPWATGEWAYLWEHRHGALHVYLSAHQRWQHLATVPAGLLRDRTLGPDIEARTTWVADGDDSFGWLDRSAARRR